MLYTVEVIQLIMNVKNYIRRAITSHIDVICNTNIEVLTSYTSTKKMFANT